MTKDERWHLWHLRKAANQHAVWHTWNVPEPGYAECTWCAQPHMGNSLCDSCSIKLNELENKYAASSSKSSRKKKRTSSLSRQGTRSSSWPDKPSYQKTSPIGRVETPTALIS